MRALMFLFRMIFGVIFILSGFFKVIDPVGTSLIVEEYMHILHLDFLRAGSLVFGIMLSVLEFVVGIAVVMCVRMRVISWVALVMTVFFTVLTTVTAYFDLMDECGCFGEAIRLAPWQTVMKNVLLLICIIPVFLFRKHFKLVAPPVAAWSFLGVYGVVALGLALYSYLTLPLGDFGNFKAGSNIAEKMDEIKDVDNFETVFVYSKDGKTEHFSLDALPDTSWTYVSRETIYKGDRLDLLFDMTLSSADGSIVSDEIVYSGRPTFIAVVHRPGKIDSKYWERLMEAQEMINAYGGWMYVAAPAPHPVLDSLQVHNSSFPRVVYGDYKTLISMARSNGAVLYMNYGMVVKKWPARKFDVTTVVSAMSEDSEETMAMGTIYRRLFYESAVLLMFLIIVVFRYVCGIIYGGKRKLLLKKVKR